ncbi:hypothetical protein EYF80_045771 [Liparis tanakae]|uniref:Uncharacterized protein n=1 Tax=Liparis tanakae TaxID=230148 RepID=A0A4Z2FS26_9TELE|nr:hypothetical protein EYF80_045771 [Liparis tanakae]
MNAGDEQPRNSQSARCRSLIGRRAGSVRRPAATRADSGGRDASAALTTAASQTATSQGSDRREGAICHVLFIRFRHLVIEAPEDSVT